MFWYLISLWTTNKNNYTITTNKFFTSETCLYKPGWWILTTPLIETSQLIYTCSLIQRNMNLPNICIIVGHFYFLDFQSFLKWHILKSISPFINQSFIVECKTIMISTLHILDIFQVRLQGRSWYKSIKWITYHL